MQIFTLIKKKIINLSQTLPKDLREGTCLNSSYRLTVTLIQGQKKKTLKEEKNYRPISLMKFNADSSINTCKLNSTASIFFNIIKE